MLNRVIIVALLFVWVARPTNAQTMTEARDVYNKMMKAMANVKTATFTIEMNERIYGKMQHGIHEVKLQTNPVRVYLKVIKPDMGAEVLYKQGWNGNRALINPNAFPFINISLSPTNPLLRKHHHYTIVQLGFAKAYSIMRYYEQREKDRFYGKLKLSNDPSGNYYILEIDNNEFGFINYKVAKGENISSIADKFAVNDQMILELNSNITDFDDVSTGQVITIPNSFARRIVMYVNKQNMIPEKQLIYDHKGLYSQVEFRSLQINPMLSEMDFSSENPQYGF
jgi:Protein of unknown function (DUF1571)/LysM domain